MWRNFQEVDGITAKKIMFPELARVTRICQPCSSYMDCHMKASQHLAFVISFPFFLNEVDYILMVLANFIWEKVNDKKSIPNLLHNTLEVLLFIFIIQY